MSIIGEQNPEWLSRKSFDDSFDWSNSLKTNFALFFEYVTLHDSEWKTINLTAVNETILSIQLDAFWNKEYALKTENTDNWPFLIIKIPNVLNISYNNVDYMTTIGNSSSERIDRIEIENIMEILTRSKLFPEEFYNRLIDCKSLCKTKFEDVYGGNIEILHEEEILILLMESDGTYIDPTLEKVVPFVERYQKEKKTESFISKLWKNLSS